MRKYNHVLLKTVFFGVSLIASISCSLTPFLIEKNYLKNDVVSFNKNIKEYANLDNYNDFISFYKNDDYHEIIFFSSKYHFITTTINQFFSSNEIYQYKNKLSIVFEYNNKNIKNGGGFAYVSFIAKYDMYIFTITNYTSSYIVLRVFTFLLPILISLIFLIYFAFDYFKRVSDTKYLKHQIRRLRQISQIDSLVEYDNDVENLAYIVKDTRKKLEEELKNNYISENKLEFILDSIEQGIIVINSAFKIILSNKKGRDFLHIDNKEKFEAIDDSLKDIIINIKVTLKTHRNMVFNKEISGLIFEINLNYIESSFDGAKEEIASLLIVDVTEKFNSEKMKRDFFANAAHELKSPLTSILGFQELIQDGLLTSKEELKNANEKTLKEGERMKKLIMEMLELSSLENNNLRPIEKIDVGEEINNILIMLENQINEKNIKIVKNYKKIILKMNIDDFYNLFKNLIENAIKYNHKDGEIIINLDPICKKISIKDSGIGITDEDKQRIFERFYRVDKARSKENGGTGLGLSIVKYICNYYNFKIEVISKINYGSEFIIHY